ncbi:M48 family metallopeptidase [Sulfitobacter sp. M57]|uniref:M48 family metallopeptidase n=1 Tax=unclassified Sulfitobacter TaxID=196795 RepID=UPI0023E0E41E|nr:MULTISPECIES: M48 family metallopeptidase [unclassified Sulfitobacter]MDF3416157.1 M48 family metallopeptidase [Sulfitobacter sp. KE5]MDF3423636.1 M48 family metallopeptidase [Sulfitobacter sp. KE43]MDF3434703.1 M48 family metallopeptidase [Sulfitobacter sp. KE42]MDF3460342.1 M48 family metallopeptidase [Sulfitobacter sp. S74]MDF3464240.1 M48 family metallopeptidase [Sulfitobacter sp. Ks18]
MSLGFDGLGAAYFDGDSPVAQNVSMHIAAGILQIGLDDGVILRWPVEEVRQLPDSAGGDVVTLRRTTDPLARLCVTDQNLLKHLPERHRAAPPKGRGRLAAWAIAAVAAVGVQIFVLVPLLADNLAGFIPPAGERALGEATFGQIREAMDETGLNPLQICEGPEGRAALEALVQRLNPDSEMRHDISLSVLDHDMVNAFALPGGFVVLFRGLIEAAEGPDELASVLAHEIGHVVSRDPTRHALRSAGSIGILGLLFGDFAGGAAVLFLTERLISAQYSQAAETAADEFAHRMLAQAGINPGALGDMFATMREEGGDANGVIAHLLSHPALDARIKAAHAQVDAGAVYTPSMSKADWAAVQAICN